MTTVLPLSTQRLSHTRVLAWASAGVAIASIAATLAFGIGSGPLVPSKPASGSAPAELSLSEVAAVRAAGTSGNPRLERIAAEVVAGRAGVSALADPATLHHHGVSTATPSARELGRAAADRFHHR